MIKLYTLGNLRLLSVEKLRLETRKKGVQTMRKYTSRVSLLVTEKQKADIKLLGKITDQDSNTVVRQAIDNYLNSHLDELNRAREVFNSQSNIDTHKDTKKP